MKELSKRMIGILMIVLCVVICYPKTLVRAATVTKTILSTQYGTVGDDESKIYDIVVPKKSDVEIFFDACESCGEYTLSVTNASGTEVFNFNGGIYYDDEVLSMTLDSGTYKIIISSGDDMGFDYEFSVTAQYIDKELNNTSMKLLIGEEKQLILYDEDDERIGVEDKMLSWSTSNSAVAKVSSQGIVTAVAPGTATVTAIYGGEKYNCSITVKSPSLNKKSVTINYGGKMYLHVKDSKCKVEWSSSNNKIVSVNTKGQIYGKKAGKAIVYAKVGRCKLKCQVTVRKPAISVTTNTLGFGKSNSLYIKNCDAKIIWKSSNKNIAKVNSKGYVTAGKKAGKAVITAEFMGQTLKCTVTVKDLTYAKVKKTYKKEVLKSDTVWYVDRRLTNNEYGDTVVHPFEVVNGGQMIFSLFPEEKCRFAIFDSSNKKVWEKVVTKESHCKVNLKKGNYKLKALTYNNKHYRNGYSYRVVSNSASFMPFEDGYFSMNSVGGIEPHFLILNNLGKTIKYIDFNVDFYNRVGDLVYNEIDGYSSAKLNIIGPINNFECFWYDWNPVFYNYNVHGMKITTATITFMDGSKQDLNINKMYYNR